MAVSSPGPRRGDCLAMRTGGGGGAIAAADMPPAGPSISSVVAAPAVHLVETLTQSDAIYNDGSMPMTETDNNPATAQQHWALWPHSTACTASFGRQVAARLQCI